MALGLIIVIAIPLYALRAYQAAHVRELVAAYEAARIQPLTYGVEPGSAEDRVLLRLHGLASGMRPHTMRCDYIVLDLREDHGFTGVFFRNRPILSPVWQQTLTIGLTTPAGLRTYPTDITRIFFPAYSGPESVFEGIEVPKSVVGSVKGVYRVSESSKLPLLLWLTLRPDWIDLPPFQRLLGPEMLHTVAAFPDTDEAMRGKQPTTRLTSSDMILIGPAARVRHDRISVMQQVDSTNNDYVNFRAQEMRRGDTCIVEGSLRLGCISVLLNKSGLFLPVYVHEPGPFRAVVTVPEDGVYTVIIANSSCYGPNDWTIDRVGWIEERR
jgi:hypothetical protein